MGETIVRIFEETARARPTQVAARYRDFDRAWDSITWQDFSNRRLAVAAGLLELGVAADDRVNILANTSMAWMIADLAIQSAGAQTVPIYQSNLAHEVEYIVNDCGAVVVFAEDASQLEKLTAHKDEMPNVRKVVVMNGEVDGSEWTIDFAALERLGKDKLDDHRDTLRERIAAAGSDDVLTIIYTSGTTGKPKGVVLTHGCMAYEIEANRKVGITAPEDLVYLFLPMAHVFAKVLQSTWLGLGYEALIDADITRISANLTEQKPTLVASVPRIFEKVYAKVVGNGLEAPGMKGKLFKWAVDVNDRYATKCIAKEPVPFGLQMQLDLAKKLVFSKVEERLAELFGGRLKFFVSGGAPLPKKMAYFFDNAGVKILEGYGLTETSGGTCVNRPEKYKLGTVGPPLPGTEVRIADDGEVLIRGPGVMREYYGRPDATKEVLSADGWFATGDIGVVDEDGYLTITDRKKDIIVTAGGKNVAPQNIENQLKAANPLISQVMVYGDKRKYLSALITLEREGALKLGADRGVEGGYEAVASSDAARRAVQETIDAVNAQLARYETIKKFAILERDFEVGKELTPTLKVKRKHCTEQYGAILSRFYDEAVVE